MHRKWWILFYFATTPEQFMWFPGQRCHFRGLWRVKYCILRRCSAGINSYRPTESYDIWHGRWGSVLLLLLSVQRFLQNLVEANMLTTRCVTHLLLLLFSKCRTTSATTLPTARFTIKNKQKNISHLHTATSQYLSCTSKFCKHLCKKNWHRIQINSGKEL